MATQPQQEDVPGNDQETEDSVIAQPEQENMSGSDQVLRELHEQQLHRVASWSTQQSQQNEQETSRPARSMLERGRARTPTIEEQQELHDAAQQDCWQRHAAAQRRRQEEAANFPFYRRASHTASGRQHLPQPPDTGYDTVDTMDNIDGFNNAAVLTTASRASLTTPGSGVESVSNFEMEDAQVVNTSAAMNAAAGAMDNTVYEE